MNNSMDFKKLKVSAFIGLIVLCSNIYSDDILSETRIITGLSLGYSNFTFPEKLDHDISFPSANATLAATVNKWQLSFVQGFTLKDADVSEEEDIGKASRNDSDFTLGYSLTRNWAVFGGYKSGKTKMQYTSRESLDEGFVESQFESYSQKGPYAGISYSHHFDKAGSLNVSIAYANLNATNVFKANTDEEEEEEDEEEIEFDDLTGQIKGKLKGFSYSIAWTMPLSSKLLFQTKFKVNKYKQDINFDGLQFNNIDENFTSLHVGLAYVF